MQSKKRFTETNIWDDPVFMGLSAKQKLLWFFINDRCDNIGVWTPNPKLIAFNLDIEGNPSQFLDDFLQAINTNEKLIYLMETGDWLIANFVKFQFCKSNPLSVANSAHQSYLQLIKDRNLSEWFFVNYPETLPESFIEQHLKTSNRPPRDPFETYKDKDKEKDKDTDKDKVQVKRPISNDLEAFNNFAP